MENLNVFETLCPIGVSDRLAEPGAGLGCIEIDFSETEHVPVGPPVRDVIGRIQELAEIRGRLTGGDGSRDAPVGRIQFDVLSCILVVV